MRGTIKEIGTIFRESQGSFAPELLASEVYSRRFAKYDPRSSTWDVLTIECAAVYSESSERFYPEAIETVDYSVSDPEDVSSSERSNLTYDSDVSYIDFDTAEEAEKVARNYIERLTPDYVF